MKSDERAITSICFKRATVNHNYGKIMLPGIWNTSVVIDAPRHIPFGEKLLNTLMRIAKERGIVNNILFN